MQRELQSTNREDPRYDVNSAHPLGLVIPVLMSSWQQNVCEAVYYGYMSAYVSSGLDLERSDGPYEHQGERHIP